MSNSEEQLYHACINFCEVFFKLLCEKEKIRKGYTDIDSELRLRYTNEHLDFAYERLFKAIENWENESKGVFGANEYELKLVRIDKEVKE